MKKRFITSLFLIWMYNGCLAQNKNIKVYYIDNQEDKVYLDKKSFYDIEEKPTIYYIDNPVNKSIYIIEIYRLINSTEHFYRSFTISDLDIGNGFDIKGVFTDVTSPFITPAGYVIRICRTDKEHYLKLKSREQCSLSVEYKILKVE